MSEGWASGGQLVLGVKVYLIHSGAGLIKALMCPGGRGVLTPHVCPGGEGLKKNAAHPPHGTALTTTCSLTGKAGSMHLHTEAFGNYAPPHVE